MGLAQLVADNACAHRFILGPAAPDGWRSLDLAAHRGRATRNGAPAGEGIGSNVLGGPAIALTWLANELSRHGMTLAAGQVVTTGTCLVPLPIAAGDHIEGDLGVPGAGQRNHHLNTPFRPPTHVVALANENSEPWRGPA